MTRRRQEDSDVIGLIEGLELPYEPLMFAHPLFVSAAEPEGFAMLPELLPPRGPLVLGVYRAVLAWARGPRVALATLTPERMDPWEKEALVEAYVCAQKEVPDTELVVHLAVILSELRRPEDADSDEVALRCLNVSDWALEKGMRETAMAFAELAAIAWPGHCRYAWIAGKVYRGFGRMREAEFWLLRASRLAVWYKDWEVQAMSLNSLGNLCYTRGDYTTAMALLHRALRLTTRYKYQSLGGEVLHDLCVVSFMVGDFRTAEIYAEKALRRYVPAHSRLPALAYDVAYLWITQGYFSRAIPVLETLLNSFKDPVKRFQVAAALARAAGASGNRELFDRMWEWGWSVDQLNNFEGVVPAALIDFGLGAGSLQNWLYATEALTRAAIVAAERGEIDVVVQAENALVAIRQEQSPEKRARSRGSTTAAMSNVLALKLVRALQSGVEDGDEL